LLVISDLVWSLQVISIKDGMPTWICEICVTAPTTEEAIEYVKKVETELQLDIQ
jgi:biotin synthase-related radical SAM superfamily protein